MRVALAEGFIPTICRSLRHTALRKVSATTWSNSASKKADRSGQDRSRPAEDAPFPPVEAYEDWGPTAPDFAGNIRLEKLDSPQDISRALVQTERRVGFDAATRGRVTQEETARLASELNMTPEQLLSRRKGQAFNAEEALAARQLLAKSSNELVNAAKRIQWLDNPGDELLAEFRQKWMRHVAIQEQVSGMTAEAGRVLQQFRMAAESRAVRGDVLSGLVRAGGGEKGIKEAAETLLEAVEMGPGKFNALSEESGETEVAQQDQRALHQLPAVESANACGQLGFQHDDRAFADPRICNRLCNWCCPPRCLRGQS